MSLIIRRILWLLLLPVWLPLVLAIFIPILLLLIFIDMIGWVFHGEAWVFVPVWWIQLFPIEWPQ